MDFLKTTVSFPKHHKSNDILCQCVWISIEILFFFKNEWYFNCHNKVFLPYSKPNSCKKFFIYKSYLQAFITTIYMIFVVDKITYFCYLDCHDIAPLNKVIKDLIVGFLEYISLAISKSMYPSNWSAITKL